MQCLAVGIWEMMDMTQSVNDPSEDSNYWKMMETTEGRAWLEEVSFGGHVFEGYIASSVYF